MSLMNKTRLIYLWTHRPASFTHCFSLFSSQSLSHPSLSIPSLYLYLTIWNDEIRQGHGYLWLVGFYLYCFSSNITINVHDRSEADFDSTWQFHCKILSRSILLRSIPSRRFHCTIYIPISPFYLYACINECYSNLALFVPFASVLRLLFFGVSLVYTKQYAEGSLKAARSSILLIYSSS